MSGTLNIQSLAVQQKVDDRSKLPSSKSRHLEIMQNYDVYNS